MGVAVRLSRAGAPVRAARHAEPQSPQFLDRFVQTLLPLLEASPGGTLVLCTTLRAVDKVASLLADAFDDAGHEWPLLKQGDATRRDLLERSASCRIRCWWAAPASGKASTCPATC